MNRNIKEIEKKIKSSLIKGHAVDPEDVQRQNIFLTESEYNSLVHNLKILYVYSPDKDTTFVLIQHSNAGSFDYKVLIVADYPLNSNILEKEDVSHEIWMLAISELNIQPNPNIATDLYINENLFIGSEIDADSFWEKIIISFPHMTQYELLTQVDENNKFEIQLLIQQIAISYYCDNPQSVNLHFSSETILEYMNIVNSTDKYIPYENICQSIIANKWKFCFLDLFRCIERLFRLSMVHEFQFILNSSKNKVDIANFVKKKLNEGHQKDQIEYLFTLLPLNITNQLSSVFPNGVISEKFYNTRNDIVHFQKDEKEYDSFTNDQWNKLIQFSLDSILFLYGTLSQYIQDLPDW